MTTCELCCNDMPMSNNGEPICLDARCSTARIEAEEAVVEWSDAPEQEEKFVQMFFDDDRSPAAVWWFEMERPKLFREFWGEIYEGK